MRLFRRLSAALLTIVLGICVLGASGDHARFNDLGHRMMCVCGCNQILLECNHVGCSYSERMRNQLLSATQQNSNDDSILQAFVKEYGTTVLAAPTMQGFDKVAWIMPFAVFLTGSVAATMLILNWSRRQALHAVSTGPGPALDHYRRQAREETEL
jgi:cytochrome c-type biogenesis protein CcmH/NrfF